MKKNKILLMLLALVMIVTTMTVVLVGCNTKVGKTVAIKSDADEESYGIAVKKNDTETLTALNKVLNAFISKGENEESDFDKARDFHFNGNEASKLERPNLSDNGADVLTVYTESSFAPYEYLGSDNKVTGIDIDIAYLLAEELNCKLDIKDITFDTIIGSLENSKSKYAIAAAGMTITEERKKVVDFSIEYVTSIQYIISAEGIGYSTLADLKGKKVACQESTTGHLILKDLFDAQGVKEVIDLKRTTDCYNALKTGKVDAILLDSFPARKLVESDKDNAK